MLALFLAVGRFRPHCVLSTRSYQAWRQNVRVSRFGERKLKRLLHQLLRRSVREGGHPFLLVRADTVAVHALWPLHLLVLVLCAHAVVVKLPLLALGEGCRLVLKLSFIHKISLYWGVVQVFGGARRCVRARVGHDALELVAHYLSFLVEALELARVHGLGLGVVVLGVFELLFLFPVTVTRLDLRQALRAASRPSILLR